jgi:3D-(3,5/4)-trihydroxycyclohexane-1,2-dione acylhydrolase (decyclizing)
MTTVSIEERSLKKNSSTLRLTAAQAVIRYLAAQNSEMLDGSIEPLFAGMFGIFGHGNVAGIGEALYGSKEKLPYLRGQNEQGMAHAAIAFAKAKRCRRVMGVTTSIGPGATNLVTASALAHINRIPVLFLPGDIFASRRPDPVLQQLEDERQPLMTVNSCFQPVSRYFDCITRPEQLLTSLPRAIRTMMDPISRGPVCLAFPQDVQTEAYEYPSDFFEPWTHEIFRAEPDARQLEGCVALINKAKRPLIIAGGGVHYSGAMDVLREFSTKYGIPVGETQAGKGSLPWNDPLNLGGIGVTGTSCANKIASNADVVICVGTRLSDFTTASKTLFSAHNVQFIGLNVSSFDAAKCNAASLVADAKRSLLLLNEKLENYSTSRNYQRYCKEEINKWQHYASEVCSPVNSSLPGDAQVLSVINEVAGEDGIIVCAAGGLPGELHKLWNTSRDDGYQLEYGYSCMGYEIAGGLGVKLAHPQREVFVLVGDGSYLMLHTELVTARQLGIKINVIVVDNKGYGCINRLQQNCGNDPFGNLLRNKEGEEVKIDFAANARSYGCHAVHVSGIPELRKTLRENCSRKETTVTVIDTDPSINTPGTAWWDVAIPEISPHKKVVEVRKMYEDKLKNCSRLA